MNLRLGLLLLPLLAVAQTAGPIRFEDVTAQSGVNFTHSFGAEHLGSLVESTGAGCVWFDYNNDGRPDLFDVTNIDMEGDRLRQFRRSALRALRVDVGNGDGRAVGGELPGNGLPDAIAAAGDEGHPAAEIDLHSSGSSPPIRFGGSRLI